LLEGSLEKRSKKMLEKMFEKMFEKKFENKTENHFSLYPRSEGDINLYTRLKITMQCLVNYGESMQ
jgi:hypothetical protein